MRLALAAGNYNHEVTGFGRGDVLDFPDGVAATVNNESFTDGRVQVQWASGGQTIVVTLTGLTAAVDATLNSGADFVAAFGAGTIV